MVKGVKWYKEKAKKEEKRWFRRCQNLRVFASVLRGSDQGFPCVGMYSTRCITSLTISYVDDVSLKTFVVWSNFDTRRLSRHPSSSPSFAFRSSRGRVFPGLSSLELDELDASLTLTSRFALFFCDMLNMSKDFTVDPGDSEE